MAYLREGHNHATKPAHMPTRHANGPDGPVSSPKRLAARQRLLEMPGFQSLFDLEPGDHAVEPAALPR
jgi:hypothetical protein